MLYSMRSIITGRINQMDIPVTPEEIEAWQKGDQLIQHAFPHLTPDQREFLQTGSTPWEWDEAFPEWDEQEDVHFGEDESWNDDEPF